MADADKIEDIELDAPSEYTETEQKAMDDGWIPSDRFDKDEQGKDFVSAEKYLENGSFFKKIKAQNDKIEQLQSTITGINEHNQRVTERDHAKLKQEYEARIDVLKEAKVQALDDGDNQRVVDIDEQIRTTEKPVVEVVTNSDQAIDDWKKRNEWYDKDEFLGDEADSLASQYAGRGIPLAEGLEKITRHLKEKYPERFENPNRRAAPSVESGGTPKPRLGGQASEKDLTKEESSFFNDLNVSKYFKDDKAKSKYIKEVIESRD